jgi:hypothetical protein
VNPADAEWFDATRPEFDGELENHGPGTVMVRPIIEVIDDLSSERWDGFVCTPMNIDWEDYLDLERWWL